MKLAIMQPYFLPYIGYWQLIKSANIFVVYDNIQYTKKGWFNRNRYLQNGEDRLFTINLRHDSDYLDVKDRYISPDFSRSKLISQLKGAYQRAPYYNDAMPLVEKIIKYDSDNLFEYIYNSIKEICGFLDIGTDLVISSSLSVPESLKADKQVIAICKTLGADTYINPPGGINLYNKDDFNDQGVELKFIKPKEITYKQFTNDFVPWLSIIDAMMFNSQSEIKKLLGEYELV